MTLEHLVDEDEREERRRARIEAREARGLEVAGPAAANEPGDGDAIQFVDEPPTIRGRGRSVPALRQKLIDTARQNPGRWLRYQPSPEQDGAKPGAISGAARAGKAGFSAGFESKVVERIVYIRFVGDES